jgi:hypothetical protein
LRCVAGLVREMEIQMAVATEEKEEWYHEKQWLGHCAVHTLNNLFQMRWMTYSKMKKISTELYYDDKSSGLLGTCSMNPYSSQIPYAGYFDIGCLVMALKQKDCEISNHVVNVSDVENMDLNSPLILGFIINEENSNLFGLWTSRHWYAILFDHERQSYVNLDSQLSDAQIISTESQLRVTLRDAIRTNQSHIFVVSKVNFTN